MSRPAFTPGQPVNVCFNRDSGEPFTLVGVVLANIDAVCSPLTNMWHVEITDGVERGARFGISGKALVPRNH